MRDIPPEEMAKREYICGKVRNVLSLFGYSLVEPTHIEKIETLHAKAGPGVEKEIYAFEDKGGRRLGLRFDLTVGMARMIASNPDWPKPVRLAAISNVWRYDEPQYGRYRSVEQWDVEIFGSENPAADAEIVEISCRMMDSLGLDRYEMVLNDRQVVDAFLASISVDANRPEVLRVMDKKGKIPPEEMADQLAALSLNRGQIDSIFRFASTRGSIFEVCDLLRNDPNVGNLKCMDRMEEIGRILEKSVGLDGIFFDLSLVRGLDYYTGFVFECLDPDDRDLGSILGGGRFDGLAGIYGRDCPAVGCAGGLERLLLSLESKHLIPRDVLPAPLACIAPVTQGEMPEAMKIAAGLRKAGISAVVEIMDRKLRKTLEVANRAGHAYVVIVGRRDLASGLVTVREMKTGREKKAAVEDVASILLNAQS